MDMRRVRKERPLWSKKELLNARECLEHAIDVESRKVPLSLLPSTDAD